MRPDQVRDGLAETFLLGEKAMDADAVRAGGWYWDEPIVLGGSGGTGRKGARLLRDAGGIPAHGNQRSLWDAGCRWDLPNPEHR